MSWVTWLRPFSVGSHLPREGEFCLFPVSAHAVLPGSPRKRACGHPITYGLECQEGHPPADTGLLLREQLAQ